VIYRVLLTIYIVCTNVSNRLSIDKPYSWLKYRLVLSSV